MAIEMAGGVYCPLSPRDPEERLHTLVEQVQNHLIFIHWTTRHKFRNDYFTFDVDTIINVDKIMTDDYLKLLSSVTVTLKSISYIVFTSGSTGTPKAVSSRSCFPTV